WSGASSKTAVTVACFAPGRSSGASLRAPSARPSAAGRVGLPAPGSPGSTVRAGPEASARRAMRTASPIDNPASIGRLEQPGQRARHERRVFLLRPVHRFAGDELIALGVPLAGGIIVAEDRRHLARLFHDAELGVGLG